MNNTAASATAAPTGSHVQLFLSGPARLVEYFADGSVRSTPIEVLRSTDRDGNVDGTCERRILWDGTTIVDVDTSSTCSDIFGTARFVNGILESAELFHYDGYSVEAEDDEMFDGFLDGFDPSFDAFGPFTVEEI
jgi:hypothetical protein